MRIAGFVLLLAGSAFAGLPAPVSALSDGLFGSRVVSSSSGNIYLAGVTNRRGLPVSAGAYQPEYAPGTCLAFGFFGGPQPFDCYDFYVAKLDASGTQILAATYFGGTGGEYPYDLVVAPDGSMVLAGQSDDATFLGLSKPGSTANGGFVARLSPDFSRVSGAVLAPVYRVALAADGTAWTIGQTYATTPQTPVLSRITSDGSLVSQTPLSEFDSVSTLAIDQLGNVFVGGHRFLASAAVLRYDPAGNRVAMTNIGDNFFLSPSAMVISSGSVFVSGAASFGGDVQSPPGGYVGRIDDAGKVNILRIGGQAGPMIAAPGGRVYVLGHASGVLHTTADAVERCRAIQGFSGFIARWDGKTAQPEFATYFSQTAFGNFTLLTLDEAGTLTLNDGPPGTPFRFKAGGAAQPPCLDPVPANLATDPWFSATDPYFVPPAVAPGELVAFYGAGIGPAEEIRSDPDKDGFAPRELGGVQLTISGIHAPLLSVAEHRINAIVPFGVSPTDKAPVEVIRDGHSTVRSEVQVDKVAPAIYSKILLNPDGSINTSELRASPGDVVAVYVSGGGALTPAASDGVIVQPPLPAAAERVAAFIEGAGGAEVTYAGQAPGAVAGLMQVNVRVNHDFTYHGRMTLYLLFAGQRTDVPLWIK